MADSIDPATFSAELAVGESVTLRKTVTVSDAPPTAAKIDVHFLFDTSGSMGGEIAAAQAAADDLLAELAAFGDVASSVGVYSEAARLAPAGTVPGRVINSALTTDVVAGAAAIGAVTLSDPDNGGDGPENGTTAAELVAENVEWRDGSTRFVFMFGDAGFKTSDLGEVEFGMDFDDLDNVDLNPISTVADAVSALDAEGIELFGLSYGSSFTAAIEALGGEAFASTLDPADIVDDITSGIIAGFSEYGTVTVDDLGGGDPLISVSTVCVSADSGSCVGSDAVGMFDRSVERSFEFDVTFTRDAEGLAEFETFALVDGGIVATEKDTFTEPSAIPLPAGAWLMLAGLGGLAATRRRKKAA
ncbi:VPLPA-CTERM sorting domain-containing protein [Dinoroseobacter sp. PD6]|uniref:VPLPA-CTERM sorting domain-containing protein n=1 Tax=Dinoroseobacter sp. PD6 TaxID=3028384 RepID=UPI00237AD04E|nr:VPLPA-CTERM sorting domain-containing protein [Dinoroseobacter sp. PD6]MDD9716179.1 VPLPA-CTERM sorting domain-containing protein [Dinoroseobacter sp. PD6]